MVQLHIRCTHNVRSRHGKAFITDQAGERGRVKLHIVTMVDRRLLGILRSLARRAPGSIKARIGRKPLNDRVCLLAELGSLCLREDALHQ